MKSPAASPVTLAALTVSLSTGLSTTGLKSPRFTLRPSSELRGALDRVPVLAPQ